MSTLYVNNASNSNCSDAAGLGTQAQPFCTLQAAVNVVNPGQTVSIASGTYQPTTITRSGTAAAPINIVGAAPPGLASMGQSTWIGSDVAPWTGVALTISGASHVDIAHVGFNLGSAGALLIAHSSDITLNRTTASGLSAQVRVPLVDITGASSSVTFERSIAAHTLVTAIQIDGGSTGTMLTTDIVSTDGTGPAVSASDAPGTDIVSSEVDARCQAIDVSQGSLNPVVENDFIRLYGANCAAASAALAVDSTAAPTATADYNAFENNASENSADVADYSWAGAGYPTPAPFSAATGQGVHDSSGTFLTDSADSAAPGELPTDIYERPRVDDPLVADTGAGPVTYYDRGPEEYQEPISISTYYASAGQAPTGGTMTFTAVASDQWDSALTYTFDFGDGATKTNTTGVATHAYTTAGSFTASVTVTGMTAKSVHSTASVTIVPPAPLVASMALTSAGSMTAVAAQQSTDAWSISGYSVDFGDGTTPMQAVTGTPRLIHSYAKLGTYNVTLTTTDADGNKASTSQQFTTAGSEYTAYGPVRVLDTRHGTGTGGVVAKVGANQTLHLKIAGNGAIPANVSAVAFNLTVTNPGSGGYLVAFPDGESKPATSNLNFTAGQTKATNVVVGVGKDGDVSLYNGSPGTVDLVADVNGYFTQTAATRYTPVAPTRILDTRHQVGVPVSAKLGGGKTLTLTISGAQSGTGVTAVALNLTAVDEAGSGYVTVYPDGSTRPVVSSLNFDAGQIVPNTVIVPVGNDGKIDLYNGSGGSIDLVADLQGYFSAGGMDAYVPLSPQRLFDTRTSGGAISTGRNTIMVQPLGESPQINFALSLVAYVYNVTVTHTTGSGYVTVYPTDETLPLTSNVNFAAGQTTSNTAITAGSRYGADDYFTTTFSPFIGTTDLVVDLFGYFSAQ